MTTPLLEALYAAHDAVALRGNLSHQSLALSAIGSGDYFKAISAALLTLGGVHAPLWPTYQLLSTPNPVEHIQRLVGMGRKVPGWGNSFIKGEPDPDWHVCATMLEQENRDLSGKISMMTAALHALKKPIYPNPSCYTAAVAIHYQLDIDAVGELLVRGRLSAWTREFIRVKREAPCLV